MKGNKNLLQIGLDKGGHYKMINRHKQLIDNIFDDFKDFFPNKKDSKFIKYEFNHSIMPMKVARTGSKSHIVISNDIEFLDIESDESKIFILFMIGHELAHLVNKHLEHKDRDKFDSQTLEMWADYFGAKISMSIFQNGTRFNKMLNSNFKDANIGLEIIFRALTMMKDKIYMNTNSSNKYLNNNVRMSAIIAGISSFLTRKEMIVNFKISENQHAKIGSNWGIAINKKIHDLGMWDKLYTIDVLDTTDITEEYSNIKLLVQNVCDIHNKLKGKNRKLIKGLDFYHSYILDTSYEDFKPNQKLIDEFNKKLDNMGWDIKL
jgi:hypothetical protein